MQVTIGVELEGTATRFGELYDLKTLLGQRGGVAETDDGTITTDMGPWQGELITKPCGSGEEIRVRLEGLLDGVRRIMPNSTMFRLDPVHEALYATRPDGQLQLWRTIHDHPFQHPRVVATFDALRDESQAKQCAAWPSVALLSSANSTHFHVGKHDGVRQVLYTPRERRVLCCLLGNIGPHLLHYMRDVFGVQDDPRRMRIWHQFPSNARKPRYGLWYFEDDAILARSRAAPRLVRQLPQADEAARERWAVDLMSFPTESEECWIAHKAIWDPVRFSPRLGTIEFRMPPSQNPAMCGVIATLLIKIAEATLLYLEDHAIVDEIQCHALYQYLRGMFGECLPREPLGPEVWCAMADIPFDPEALEEWTRIGRPRAA